MNRPLNTSEAALYLGYKTTSGIRQAVRRGELRPYGRGARSCLLFLTEELDRFAQVRAMAYWQASRQQGSSEAE